ncbi:MAG TPA: S8 family serine peptidase, partial [Bryobacteraceae bacterium]
MRLNRYSALFILGALVAAAADDGGHVPGRLLVRRRAGVDVNTLHRTLRARNAALRQEMGALGVSVIDVPEQASAEIRRSLEESGLFDIVEPDYYAHTAGTPNDPSYASEWHLAKIQAPAAWGLTTGSPSVLVAVIDSGVDKTHPDLAGKLVTGWSFLKSSADVSDTLGHGTAVAGTVAAATNNATGVAGVSWGSMIMPLAVVDSNDFASYSNIAAAIQYAADHGVRIINVSIGGSSPSSVLQGAVDYAWNKGAVVIASAMNDSTSTPYYPAACNHVVAVAATDENDRLASFSDYGNWIAVSAPGTNILTTMSGGGYGYWYGTSFSSPITAGVAALMLAANPSLANTSLVSMLEQSVDDLGSAGYDSSFGYGRVNAYKAVSAALGAAAPPPPPPPSVSVAPASVTLGPGQTQQFSATVTGLANTAVSWSVSPLVGTIAGGLYTAPLSIAAS